MSDYKIKVETELSDNLKEQIDDYIIKTALQFGLDYKLEKLNLSEDDILIMRLPTDENGDILVDYESALHYHEALIKVTNCKGIMTLPDDYAFRVMDDDIFEVYVNSLNRELKIRKQREL